MVSNITTPSTLCEYFHSNVAYDEFDGHSFELVLYVLEIQDCSNEAPVNTAG
ncbi:hypothetical protein D3C85_1820780 [compost metagenome]